MPRPEFVELICDGTVLLDVLPPVAVGHCAIVRAQVDDLVEADMIREVSIATRHFLEH